MPKEYYIIYCFEDKCLEDLVSARNEISALNRFNSRHIEFIKENNKQSEIKILIRRNQ